MILLTAVVLFAFLPAHASTPCRAKELALSFPSEPGEFTGMSHDGTWMELRNTGRRTCTVPRRPSLSMQDAAGAPLRLQVNRQIGLHPGPVMVPVELKPGQRVRSTLRWVVGDVYDHTQCVNVEKATLQASGSSVSATLHAHMCGEAGKDIFYDEAWLDPKTSNGTE